MSRLQVPPSGAHGGDGARLAAALGIDPDDVLDLSASLNPCAPDVAAAVTAHAGAVRRYPDAAHATEALARAIGVDPARVQLTNGGAEAVALVAAEWPVGRIDDPDFSLYARHLTRLDPAGPRWRSNPHNPTGRLAAADESAAVWDEAFYPLATGCWTRGDRDAVVIGSLTKLFACPGLRIGYVIAPDAELRDRLAARQPQWSVNALAVSVLPELLAGADIRSWSTAAAALRTQLVPILEHAGVAVEPSDATFVLCRHALGLREHLGRRGILVRDTASFGMPDGVRIAVPNHRGLERLQEALDGWCA